MDARVPVYIMSGGASRRFQTAEKRAVYEDKARHVVRGLPLIQHAVEAAEPVASSITAVAGEADCYQDLGIRTIADRLPGQGPLAGLDAALADAPPGWVLALSCDLRGLRTGWLRALLDARTPDAHAILYEEGQRLHPLVAAYHTDAAPVFRAALNAGRLKLGAAAAALPCVLLPVPAGWASLRNVNERSDLSADT